MSRLLFIGLALFVVVSSWTIHEFSDDELLWYCETICEGNGGKSYLDEENFETPACICKIGDEVDDEDEALMIKSAKATGLNLILRSETTSKRSLDESPTHHPTFLDNLLAEHRARIRARLLKPINENDTKPLLDNLNPIAVNGNLLGSRSNAVHPKKDNHLTTILTRSLLQSIKTRLEFVLNKLDRGVLDNALLTIELESIENSLKHVMQICSKSSNPKTSSLESRFKSHEESTKNETELNDGTTRRGETVVLGETERHTTEEPMTEKTTTEKVSDKTTASGVVDLETNDLLPTY